jgi:hypothetical protein
MDFRRGCLTGNAHRADIDRRNRSHPNRAAAKEMRDIQMAFETNRQRFARQLAKGETAAQRLERFVRLQRASFELLLSSPQGFQHFLRRNLRSRRVEVIHGKWRPVSPDRRAGQA